MYSFLAYIPVKGKHLICFLILLLSYAFSCEAQLKVYPNSNATVLANALKSKGFVISNPVLNAPPQFTGLFKNINCNLGLDSGIVLSSDTAVGNEGPNDLYGAVVLYPGSTVYNGDADIDSILKLRDTLNLSFDASVLEFDLIPTEDSIQFDYVFGSEEYPGSVCTPLNDLFIFLISGPNPLGGAYYKENIAIVPNTANMPVCINSINGGKSGTFSGDTTACYSLSYSQYFIDNGLPNTIDPTDSTLIQLNGFTVPLVAKVAVVPCAIYHLKIAIADGGDDVLISSVFLKAGSLKSNRQVYIDSVSYPIGLQAATEGCATARVAVALKPAQASPYTVHLQYGGSATQGADYTSPDSLVIPAGDTVGYITITALADGVVEGTEQISVQLISPCGLVYDSVLVPIQDYIPLQLSFKDTVKCPLDTVQLEASGATTYSWSPAFGLSTATIANPLCFATQTQAYICTGTIGTCTATDTVRVKMRTLSLLLLQDSILCKGDSATLYVSERNNFQPLSYTCAGNSNATGIFKLAEGNYTIQAQSPKGCTVQDTITITAPDSLKLQTLKVISPICFGDNTGSIEVTASGGTFPYNYNWNNTSVNTNSQNNLAAGNYSLTVTDAHACKTQNSYLLNSPIQVTVSVTPRDSTLENNSAVQLNSLVKPMPNAVQYLWSPALGLSCTDCPNPIAQPSCNTVYRLTVKYDNQCELSDSLYIQVKDNHLFYIPNAFSPNGDGRNEEWKLFTNSSLKYMSVQVFNRWGEKVFETEDENKGWDGTYKDVPQPVGVYAYQYTICFLNGAVEKGKGSVTVIR